MKFLPLWFPVLSWLEIAWIILTTGIGLAGGVVALRPTWTFLNDLVKYGKSQSTERSILHRSIEVPKRWFTHFYILATSLSTTAFFYIVTCYLCDTPPANRAREFVRYFASPNARQNVNALAIVLTFGCLAAHSIRRLSESLFISVYSNTKMNFLHYIVGWVHYMLVPITILSEAPGFANHSKEQAHWSDITVRQIIGLVLFVYSSYAQHQCLKILATMRRNYLGNIINYAHAIPVTGWFEYVSCPHFLFEILIYVALWFTLNLTHRFWIYVLFFVVINQVLAAKITHAWYKDKFKQYPVDRTALIPYVF